MSGFNRSLLIGNLTCDPELRYTAEGKPVCEIRIAVEEPVSKDKTITTYVSIETWGKSAENCAQYLKKGFGVHVEAVLRTNEWTDKESGKKLSRIKLVAKSVLFLPNRGSGKPKEDRPPAPVGNTNDGFDGNEDIF